MTRGSESGGGPKKPTSRVPSGRTERIARLGGMLAGIAGDVAVGALRRAAGRDDGEGSVVFTPSNAQRLADTLASMRGAAMKLGQLLSLK